jgi:hypothetical protein
MLGRHVGVAELLGFFIGTIEHARQLAGERGITASRLLGEASDLALRFCLKLRDIQPRLLQERDDDAFVLL